MASMMLLRAVRHVARSRCAAAAAAASTSGGANRLLDGHVANAAASRCAAAAASASGGADRLLGTRPSPEWLGFGLGRRPLSAAAIIGRKVKFVVEDEDIASEEALWSLYERWCKAFGEERDHDEMLRRFDCFKDFVLFVHSANKEAIRDGRTIRYEVNNLADGKIRELLLGRCGINALYELPYAKGAVVHGRARPFLSQLEETDDEYTNS